jgi:hypothetical protein
VLSLGHDHLRNDRSPRSTPPVRTYDSEQFLHLPEFRKAAFQRTTIRTSRSSSAHFTACGWALRSARVQAEAGSPTSSGCGQRWRAKQGCSATVYQMTDSAACSHARAR